MSPVQGRSGGTWKSAEAKRRSMENLRLGRGAERWRGKLTIPAKAHPLVRQMFKIMNDEMVAMCDLTRRANIVKGTISHWRTVSVPTLSLFVAVLNALGYDLAIVPKRDVADGKRGRKADRAGPG